MSNLTNTLLTQITGPISKHDILAMTNTRASHAISAALNVINLLRENYTEEQAAELEKRFINSIRTNDPRKFARGIQHIKESLDNEHVQ